MLSRTLKGVISCDFDEIQRRVDSEHAQREALSTKCEALIDKAKALDAKVAELEGEHTSLQEEVRML